MRATLYGLCTVVLLQNVLALVAASAERGPCPAHRHILKLRSMAVSETDVCDDFLNAFGFELERKPHAWGAERSITQCDQSADRGGETLSIATTSSGFESSSSGEEETADALDMLQGRSEMDALCCANVGTINSERSEKIPEPLDSGNLEQCYYLHGLFEER